MVSDLKVIHHDECQLLDWGESRSTGPWVKLRLADTEYLEAFRGLDTATAKKTGHIFNVTITQGDIIADKTDDWPGDIVNTDGAASDVVYDRHKSKKSLYGQQAKELRLSSFFRRPEVWRAVGTDQEFLDWLKTQDCCAAKNYHNGDIVAAHVRRVANGSGTGIKPEYSAIPLCDEHHQLQHQKGESAVAPREWWDKKRIEHLQKWCWETLKTKLGYTSWSDVPPWELLTWAEKVEVSGKDGSMWLPRCYYDKYREQNER